MIKHQIEFNFLDLKRRMEKKREIIQLELLSAQAGMLIAIALMTTSPVLGFLALAAFITSAAFIHSELNSINQKIREVGIEIEAVRGGNSPYLRQIKEEFDTEAKKYTDRYNYTDVMNFYKNHVSGKMSKTEITKKIGLEFLDSANKELGNQNLFGRVRDIQLNEA